MGVEGAVPAVLHHDGGEVLDGGARPFHVAAGLVGVAVHQRGTVERGTAILIGAEEGGGHGPAEVRFRHEVGGRGHGGEATGLLRMGQFLDADDQRHVHRSRSDRQAGDVEGARRRRTGVLDVEDRHTSEPGVTEGHLTPHHLPAMEHAVGGIAEDDHLHVGSGQGGVAQGRCSGLLRQ